MLDAEELAAEELDEALLAEDLEDFVSWALADLPEALDALPELFS